MPAEEFDELDALPLATLRDRTAAGAAANPGLRLVVLFGSVATGKARPDSDADIAVLSGDFWKSLELGSALAAQLGREPHVVDLASASDALRFEVARHGVMLYEAEPFAWPEYQARAAVLYFDLKPIIERCTEGVRARLRAGARS
jgi:predicted nucleotidyltransferase